MEVFREHLRNDPEGFKKAAKSALSTGAMLDAECYKRPKPDCPAGLENFYNAKYLYFVFASDELSDIGNDGIITRLEGIYKKFEPVHNANVSFIPVDRVVDRLDTLLSHNDMPAARRHLEYWLSEARMGGDKRGELAVLNELMGLYRKMGLKDKAFESAEKADELVKTLSLGGSITAATVCLNAATVCEAFDRPREALERYGEAKSIYEDFLSPGDARLGGLYNNMALACVSLKEYEQARELYQKAIEIMSALPGGKPETAITYLNLANAAEAQQGLENASEFITDCLKKAEDLLLDESNALDGNYAFVCEKCAPTFGYYGWFMTAKEIKRRSDKIYERA